MLKQLYEIIIPMQRRSQDLRKYLRRRDLYKKYCCKGLHLKYLSGSWLHFCMDVMILWLQFWHMDIPQLYYFQLILFLASNKAIFSNILGNIIKISFSIYHFCQFSDTNCWKEQVHLCDLFCLNKPSSINLSAKTIFKLISFETVLVKCTWSSIVYISSYMCLFTFFVALYLRLLTVELSFTT